MSSAHSSLKKRFERIHHLSHLTAIAGWDEAVMMPAGGGEARSNALAETRALSTELLQDPVVADWIEGAEGEGLNGWDAANLREMKRQWRNATAVSADLVAASSRAASRCEQAWRTMRAENDWKGLKPLLEEVVHLTREEAAQRAEATGEGLYDSLVDLYEPGMKAERLDELFGELKSFLPPFIRQVTEEQANRSIKRPDGPFAIEAQRRLGEQVMSTLGFNFSHGRLDVSHHPFCGGVPDDVRITTRYQDEDFTESLMGVIHETGHARYEQGLPAEWRSQPVGSSRSMGVHESQSLLFEMQVGRSPEFLSHALPLMRHQFGDHPEWTEEMLFELYTEVKPGFIRVQADEVTYPLHVILRFELERALIEGTLEVADLPTAWEEKMQQFLGLSVGDNHRDGCMQDVHWVAGIFGYFPSYTLGALLAAQIFRAVKLAHPTLPEEIKGGELATLSQWLSNAIWSQGCYHETDSLIIHATGEALNPAYFREFLQQRYLYSGVRK